ncbi:MAG: hypothetical protein JSR83_24990 [Proteobacteria bacterium]|nr:hypothetical protein [Pseudomonadota bacterium]
MGFLPTALSCATLCQGALLGRLWLAHADVVQRMHFLGSRLIVGTAENRLRAQALNRDDVLDERDRVTHQARLDLLLEAGAEGWATIYRNYLDELAAAYLCCLRGQAVPKIGCVSAAGRPAAAR